MLSMNKHIVQAPGSVGELTKQISLDSKLMANVEPRVEFSEIKTVLTSLNNINLNRVKGNDIIHQL